LNLAIIDIINPSCISNGIINTSASGGVAPYLFSIDNFTTSQPVGNFTGLGAGAYIVSVQDANGCLATTSVNLVAPLPLTVAIVNQANILCAGQANGSFTANPSGGSGTYTFQLNNGVPTTNATFSGLAAQTYTLTVADGSGCTVTTSVTLTEPPALSGVLVNRTNVSCFGTADGSVEVSAVGGIPPYTFSIFGPTQPTGIFGNLSAGNYSVVIRDASNCAAVVAFSITQPVALTASIAAFVNPTCQPTGSITVQTSGGTLPYQFSIDGGANQQGSPTFSGLPSGTYTVLVTDANGCTTTTTRTLASPNQPTIGVIGITPVSYTHLTLPTKA
jgi:hypothetical protein